jgi:hypothetical protein
VYRVHGAHGYTDCSGAVFRRSIRGFTGWAAAPRRASIPGMETDILIAGLMIFASVAFALGIVVKVARVLEPKDSKQRQTVKAPQTVPVLRPTSGW